MGRVYCVFNKYFCITRKRSHDYLWNYLRDLACRGCTSRASDTQYGENWKAASLQHVGKEARLRSSCSRPHFSAWLQRRKPPYDHEGFASFSEIHHLCDCRNYTAVLCELQSTEQQNFPSDAPRSCEKLDNWLNVLNLWYEDCFSVVGNMGTLMTDMLLRGPSLLRGSFWKDVFSAPTRRGLLASGASQDSALSLSVSLPLHKGKAYSIWLFLYAATFPLQI